MQVKAKLAFAVSIAFIVGLIIFLMQIIEHSSGCTAYQEMLPIVDAERRTELIGETAQDDLSFGAFAGLPEAYHRIVRDYLEAILDGLQTSPLTRERYYHVDRSQTSFGARFPDDVNPHRDEVMTIPLVPIPRPEVVQRWASSAHAQKSGCCSMANALRNRGSVYGHTLVFQAGDESKDPFGFPAAPMGHVTTHCDEYIPGLYFSDVPFFRHLGKIVVQPFFHGPNGEVEDGTRRLRLGESDGARLLGELLTVPLHRDNQRLRWVSRNVGERKEQFLAYALIDGNGANRSPKDSWYQASEAGDVSPYLRPLICERHQPRINQHDLLLLPVPIGWPSRLGETTGQGPYEEWALDDWFPAQQEACWVIRETVDSKPLQESFILMPAEEPSDRPVFFATVFAETTPDRLVKELASLYKVPADTVLASKETMARLQRLFADIQAFDFGR